MVSPFNSSYCQARSDWRGAGVFVAYLLALGACGDGDDGGPAASTGGVADSIEFRGEQAFLPGLDLDTGWLPDASPVAVRTTVTATGGVSVVALATSDGTQLEPTPSGGTLEIQGELLLEVSAQIDTAGISYEDVVETFGYAIDSESLDFEPFALDAPVELVSTLPAAELGSVPIPSVPGSTLVVEVTGGELTTAFVGTCAETSGGFGQYTGAVTMSGTVACAATIEIEVPVLGLQSFGPFAFDLPIAPIETAMDLGTRSLTTGEVADSMGICASSGDESSTSTGGTSDTGGTSGSSGTTGGASETGGGDDPAYPAPVGGACPTGLAPISVVSDTQNAVCLPQCVDDVCPDGLSGSAVPICAFNPDSSNVECFGETDCTNGSDPEFCNAAQGVCTLQPTHCALSCQDDASSCPDAMTCLEGFCTFVP